MEGFNFENFRGTKSNNVFCFYFPEIKFVIKAYFVTFYQS